MTHRGGQAEQGHLIRSISRLDAGTSGVLVVPLTRQGEDVIKPQFANRLVEKSYVCLCEGIVAKNGASKRNLQEICRINLVLVEF